MEMQIQLKLLSDATFGRGDGVTGLVNEEVEYDPETGLPFLRGRTLKGLLVEECVNILYALKQQNSPVLTQMQEAANFLFGQPGSTLTDDAHMHISAAAVPKELCDAVVADIKGNRLQPIEVLESLTAIRRQTAIDMKTGAPAKGSLRSLRVILRDTTFISKLDFDEQPSREALALLAACVMSLRRAGTARNRGRGRLQATLHDDQTNDVTTTHMTEFEKILSEVTG
jgi:hypothetical protein